MTNNKRKIFIKIISLFLVGTFLLADPVLADIIRTGTETLSPPLRTKSPAELVRDNGGEVTVNTDKETIRFWEEETLGSIKALGNDFRADWVFVDISYLIAQALDWQISEHTLKDLIKQHLNNRKKDSQAFFEGYDIDSIRSTKNGEEILAFTITFQREQGSKIDLTYHKTKEGNSDTRISVGEGKEVFVRAGPRGTKIEDDSDEKIIKGAILETRKTYHHTGGCREHSIELLRRLTKQGIKGRIVSSASHFWVETAYYLIDAFPEGESLEHMREAESLGDRRFIFTRKESEAAKRLYAGVPNDTLTETAIIYANDDAEYYSMIAEHLSKIISSKEIQKEVFKKRGTDSGVALSQLSEEIKGLSARLHKIKAYLEEGEKTLSNEGDISAPARQNIITALPEQVNEACIRHPDNPYAQLAVLKQWALEVWPEDIAGVEEAPLGFAFTLAVKHGGEKLIQRRPMYFSALEESSPNEKDGKPPRYNASPSFSTRDIFHGRLGRLIKYIQIKGRRAEATIFLGKIAYIECVQKYVNDLFYRYTDFRAKAALREAVITKGEQADMLLHSSAGQIRKFAASHNIDFKTWQINAISRRLEEFKRAANTVNPIYFISEGRFGLPLRILRIIVRTLTVSALKRLLWLVSGNRDHEMSMDPAERVLAGMGIKPYAWSQAKVTLTVAAKIAEMRRLGREDGKTRTLYVTGDSKVGKTTFTKAMIEGIKKQKVDDIAIIHLDDLYENNDGGFDSADELLENTVWKLKKKGARVIIIDGVNSHNLSVAGQDYSILYIVADPGTRLENILRNQFPISALHNVAQPPAPERTIALDLSMEMRPKKEDVVKIFALSEKEIEKITKHIKREEAVPAKYALALLKKRIEKVRDEIALSEKNRPAIMFIDGDSNVGKTCFAKRLANRSGIVIHTEDILAEIAVEFKKKKKTAPTKERVLTLLTQRVFLKIKEARKRKKTDVIIVEGFESLEVELLLRERFALSSDISVHIEADFFTRKRIRVFKKLLLKGPESFDELLYVGESVEDYEFLHKNVQRPYAFETEYDLIIENSDFNRAHGSLSVSSGLFSEGDDASINKMRMVLEEFHHLFTKNEQHENEPDTLEKKEAKEKREQTPISAETGKRTQKAINASSALKNKIIGVLRKKALLTNQREKRGADQLEQKFIGEIPDAKGSPVKVVIFDMGQVLARFDYGIAAKSLGGKYGIDEERARMFFQERLTNPGNPLYKYERESIEEEIITDDISAWLSREAGEEIILTIREFREIYNSIWTGAIHETVVFARALKKKGYKIRVLTNTTPIHLEFMTDPSNPMSFSSLLDDPEEDIYPSFSTRLMKLVPEAFLQVSSDAGFLPEECLMIDDYPANIDVAKGHAGLKTVLFDPSNPMKSIEEAIEHLKSSEILEKRAHEAYNPVAYFAGPDEFVRGISLRKEPRRDSFYPDHGLTNDCVYDSPEGWSIFVGDYHRKALWFWARSKERGIIPKGASLFHVDRHRDDAENNDSGAEALVDALKKGTQAQPEEELLMKVLHFSRDGNYIMTAVRAGVVGEKPEIRTSIPEEGPLIETGKEYDIVNIDIDIFDNYRGKDDTYIKSAVIPRIAQAAARARVITVATSPGYSFLEEATIMNYTRLLVEEIIAIKEGKKESIYEEVNEASEDNSAPEGEEKKEEHEKEHSGELDNTRASVREMLERESPDTKIDKMSVELAPEKYYKGMMYRTGEGETALTENVPQEGGTEGARDIILESDRGREDILELDGRGFLVIETGEGKSGHGKTIKKVVEVKHDLSKGKVYWLKTRPWWTAVQGDREEEILKKLEEHSGEWWTKHFARGMTLNSRGGETYNATEHVGGPTLLEYIASTQHLNDEEYFKKHFYKLAPRLLKLVKGLKEFKGKTGKIHGDITQRHIFLDEEDGRFVLIDYNTDDYDDVSSLAAMFKFIAIREKYLSARSEEMERFDFIPYGIVDMLKRCNTYTQERYKDIDTFMRDLESQLATIEDETPLEGKGKKWDPEEEKLHGERFVDTIKYVDGKLKEAERIGAKQDTEKPVVFLGTSWIKGYDEKTLQRQAINPLISAVRSYCKEKDIKFKEMLDEDIDKAVSTLRKDDPDAKIVVLAGKGTVSSIIKDENIYLAGVDNKNLIEEGSYIRLMEMITITLRLAANRFYENINMPVAIETSSMTIMRMDGYLLFIPDAAPMGYERFKPVYGAQISA